MNNARCYDKNKGKSASINGRNYAINENNSSSINVRGHNVNEHNSSSIIERSYKINENNASQVNMRGHIVESDDKNKDYASKMSVFYEKKLKFMQNKYAASLRRLRQQTQQQLKWQQLMFNEQVQHIREEKRKLQQQQQSMQQLQPYVPASSVTGILHLHCYIL